MVWKKVRLGNRVRKNGYLCLGMRPEGSTCFRSGKRNVAYGHFEAPEGAKPRSSRVVLNDDDERRAVIKNREVTQTGDVNL